MLPTVETTTIPGLLIVTVPVHGDARGWFKENWQRAKMVAAGVPDFGPVQNNVSFNASAGVTRGLHAEPWDKFVSVAHGRVFGAWVDVRPGDTFGTSVTVEIGPGTAVFVPRGVANGFQSLEADTVYSYLVNDHWSPAAREKYTYVNLADVEVNIPWPIPLDEAELSDADRDHPMLRDVAPMMPKRTVIVGASGQLGFALADALPGADLLNYPEFDVTNADQVAAYDWSQVGTIINASAYTQVDAAETPEGRVACWNVNVTGLGNLVRAARAARARLVHVSSDYVFDGTEPEHTEGEPFSPLGVYGVTKAAGDALVATLDDYLIVRTSWVVGNGGNFVRTMVRLAQRGVSPAVVDDQVGRLTFTPDLADAIVHLVSSSAPSGVYNVTGAGEPRSWFAYAARVFDLCGRDPSDVSPVTTEQYAVGKVLAARPVSSTLTLTKVIRAGFTPRGADEQLDEYVNAILQGDVADGNG